MYRTVVQQMLTKVLHITRCKLKVIESLKQLLTMISKWVNEQKNIKQIGMNLI